jgi:prepilin-type N-terminal cleavage/methylation domain-containing protein
MKRKGFTLVEVLIVVIIIGILAAIGIPQFATSIEKAKGGEARAGLGHIQTAEKVYFAEYEAYCPITGNSAVDSVDMSATLDIVLTQKYWTFDVTLDGTNELGGSAPYVATATRKSGGTTVKDTVIHMDNTGNIWGDWPYLGN